MKKKNNIFLRQRRILLESITNVCFVKEVFAMFVVSFNVLYLPLQLYDHKNLHVIITAKVNTHTYYQMCFSEFLYFIENIIQMF